MAKIAISLINWESKLFSYTHLCKRLFTAAIMELDCKPA